MIDSKLLDPVKYDHRYTPSDEDIKKVNFVHKRFGEMQSARTKVDKQWNIYQTMIEAIFIPYPDDRSASTVPLASSIIELYVAEALKIPTEFFFKWETSKYAANARALEHVWNYDWRKNNRKKTFLQNEYITAGFGTSIIYTWFESYDKEQQDFEIDDNWMYSWQKKVIKKEEIIVKNIDIRDFYIDNTAITGIEDASDCLLRDWMSYEKFLNFKNNPLYKNIDAVKPNNYSNDYHTFVTQEESVKSWDYVKLLRYWNVEKDIYMVVANGILIREHPMISTINWEKALPFTVRWFGYKNYSIYYRGICESLMMFQSEVNNLRELLMDAIRRSNTQVLAIWNWLSFDWRFFSYDNEMLTFDWDIEKWMKQISWNPPNQAIFEYMTQLYRDIAIYVWIDVQNIIWQPQQTAFQTEVQREASQKRINVWFANRDLAFERFANLYKDLLQTYFPRKTADWLYPEIEIDWEKLTWKWDKAKFKKIKWKSTFQVTPEILRWDIFIDVYTNVNAPTINAVDREQKLQFLNAVGSIAQWYVVAKQAWLDVESVLPIKQTIKDLAEDFNLDVQDMNGSEDETKNMKIDLVNKLQAMMGGGAMLPTEWTTGWTPPTPTLPSTQLPSNNLASNLMQWKPTTPTL